MKEAVWRWVSANVVFAIHDEQIAEHGGKPGLRDESQLHSALDRPQNLADYWNPDAADLAAAYAFEIARNRPFNDGNKRTALAVAAGVFLPLNGYQLAASDADTVRVTLSVADSSMTDSEFAAWLRANMQPLKSA